MLKIIFTISGQNNFIQSSVGKLWPLVSFFFISVTMLKNFWLYYIAHVNRLDHVDGEFQNKYSMIFHDVLGNYIEGKQYGLPTSGRF